MIELLLDLLDKRVAGKEYLYVAFSNVLGINPTTQIPPKVTNNSAGKGNQLNNTVGLGVIA